MKAFLQNCTEHTIPIIPKYVIRKLFSMKCDNFTRVFLLKKKPLMKSCDYQLAENPDRRFERDIKRLHSLSINHKFLGEYFALFSYSNCIVISFTETQWKGSRISMGDQFLIFVSECFAIGELVRIDDYVEKCIYLKLLKTKESFPSWKGYIQILKVKSLLQKLKHFHLIQVKLQLLHYHTEVYRKILEYLRNDQLKRTLNESKGRDCSFSAFRALITLNHGMVATRVSFSIYNREVIDEMKTVLRDAYFERETVIVCTYSSDRLFDLALFCSEDAEMSKQTVVFPPGTICGSRWHSPLLDKIRVLKVDYDLREDWDITNIEYDLKFRAREAPGILKDTHPRIIMGTVDSLLLVMDGIKGNSFVTPSDRLSLLSLNSNFRFLRCVQGPDSEAVLLR